MARPVGPPPKKPTAFLTLVSNVDGVIVLATAGTVASPGRTLASGSITWSNGGTTQTWTGDPPATLTQTYTTPGTYTITATIIVRDNKNGRASFPLDVDVSVAQPAVAPICLSLGLVNDDPSIAQTVRWSVLFSLPVTGVTTGAFSLVNGGLASPTITALSGSGTSYTVTADRGTGTGTLGLNLTNGTGIVGTNGLALTGVPVTGAVYTMSAIPPPDPPVAPTCLSISRVDLSPTSDATVDWTVVFSESVTGVTLGAFALVNGGLTAPSLTTLAGSGAVYTVTANRGTGTGTLGLNLTTATGIINGAGTTLTGTPVVGQVYTIIAAPSPPTCLSIVRANASPTTAELVAWTVTFSESVTGVTLSAFTFANSGLTAPQLVSIGGSGATRTVTASRGTGTGTLGLNLTNGAGIVNGAGTPLTGTPVSGSVYTIIAAQPPPPTGILTESDFTYLGFYEFALEGNDSPFLQGLTHRYVGGDLRFLYIAWPTSFAEFSLSGISLGGTVSSYSNVWPNSFPNGLGGRHAGLWWDEPNQRLWTTDAIDYNANFRQVQICTRTLNANGTTSNFRGPVGLQGWNERAAFGGAQAVPAWFQAQYNTGPYAVGWGGYTSILGNGVSLGLSLFTIPDPSGYSDDTEIPSGAFQVLSNCSSGSVGEDWYLQSGATVPTSFDRGPRLAGFATNYMDANTGGPPNGPTTQPPTDPAVPGWWQTAPDGWARMLWTDSFYATGTWIEGANKKGFVALNTVHDGLVWYGTSTIWTTGGFAFEFNVWDPARFGEAIQGARAIFNVKPASIWRGTFPGLGGAALAGPVQPPITYQAGAMTYDSTTSRLYVLGSGGGGAFINRLYVFAVNA